MLAMRIYLAVAEGPATPSLRRRELEMRSILVCAMLLVAVADRPAFGQSAATTSSTRSPSESGGPADVPDLAAQPDVSANEPILLLEAARALLAQHAATEAAVVATQAIVEAPSSAGAYHLRGRARFATGQLALAALDLRMAHVMFSSRADLAYAHYETHRQAGRTEAALIEFHRYLELGRARTDALIALNAVEARQGDINSATLHLRKKGG